MKLITMTLMAILTSGALHAQPVEVQDAWARASVAGQTASGAFMKLTARENVTLVGASSPAAAVVELHEMAMDGGVMKMRRLSSGVELPAGKTVELKPGGFHVMLMDLKSALVKDSKIALTLVFKDGKGVQSQREIQLPVLAMGAAAAHQHKP